MFYVLLEHDTNNACFVSDDDAIPQKKYDTEPAAIAAAKEYSGETLVLRAVARVTDVTRYKVEKIK